jgi:hypothetical protein
MMRRLKVLGANQKQLIDVYEKHVRSLLELAVPAWQGSITQSERIEIERVQKAAFHIARGRSTPPMHMPLTTLIWILLNKEEKISA